MPVPVPASVPASFAEMAERVSNWGRWGDDDQLGTLNLIDDAARLRGAAAVRDGEAFPLGLPMSEAEGIQMGFIQGRVNPTRSMIYVNHPLTDDPEWIASSEDVVTFALQCATHWDGLAHVSYGAGPEGPRLYNGYPASAVTEAGAATLGIHLVRSLVSRGVLLDVARAKGLEVLEPGYPITPDDLDAACGPGRPHRRAGRRGAGADRPARPPGSPGSTGDRRRGARARPGGLHLAGPGPDHGHGRVVPRPGRGRGGHRHHGPRGLPRARTTRSTCPSTSSTWWRWG